jgi:hypothetical protein
MTIITIGIDLAKNVFAVHGVLHYALLLIGQEPLRGK